MSITTILMEKVRLLPEWQQRRLLEFATKLESDGDSRGYTSDQTKERQIRFQRELGRFADRGVSVSLETCQAVRREAWDKWIDKNNQETKE